jgi:hypothetical protein
MAGREEEEGASLARVQYARNFASNLESIEAFWLDNDFAQGYERLLDALTDVVVPNLQRHPRMGGRFLNRAVESVEAKRLLERIGLQLSALGPDAEVREYVMDEYLVLYLVSDGHAGDAGGVRLLAIKHHKQLGFDVPGSSSGI